MIARVQYKMINTKTEIVHGMNHPYTSLCGLHTAFTNRNISLEKTDKKITCMRCLRKIDKRFQFWCWQFDYESDVDSFDENLHSPQLAAHHIFYDTFGLDYFDALKRITISCKDKKQQTI